MRTKITQFLFVVVLILMALPVWAQDGSVEMANSMRSDGKIYVVVAVILTILGGLIFYVWRPTWISPK
ncbi:MAG: CcmD family protein [Chitinophagaceae bacterium]